MWTWLQTGSLISPLDDLRVSGYSGKGEHKNNPASQNLENLGPIPCGVYRIGAPFDSPKHGDFCLSLTPDAANQMFGRSAFLIHGDNIHAPGTASEGCIILPLYIRKRIAASGDKMLVVQSGLVAVDPGLQNE